MVEWGLGERREGLTMKRKVGMQKGTPIGGGPCNRKKEGILKLGLFFPSKFRDPLPPSLKLHQLYKSFGKVLIKTLVSNWHKIFQKYSLIIYFVKFQFTPSMFNYVAVTWTSVCNLQS